MTLAPEDNAAPVPASRRDEILATAADLFWTSGYHATTMSELATAIGLRKASLYHHIDNKETLLYQLSLESLRRIDSAVTEAIAMSDDPLVRLRLVIESHLVTALSDRSKHATMLTELRALADDQRREISALRDAYDEKVESVIVAGQEAGVLRRDLSPKILRLSLLNMLNWTIFWFSPDGPQTAGEVAGSFATIYLDGVGVRPTGATS